MSKKKQQDAEVQGTESTENEEIKVDTAPEGYTAGTDSPKEFSKENISISDIIEFWPMGSEKPKQITVDESFLKSFPSKEIIEKYKYKKL